MLFSKTSEFGPTDFFLDPNLLPLSIYLASLYGQQQTALTYIFNYHLGKKGASLIGTLHEFLEELGIRSFSTTI